MRYPQEAKFIYNSFKKPSWAPPAWLFKPVWILLYILMFISFSKVFIDAYYKKIPRKLAIPFLLNLIFNMSFMRIQFYWRSNFLAFIDIILVLATLIYGMKKIWKYNKWIVYLNIPYLLWVSFAAFLQISITLMNYEFLYRSAYFFYG